MTMTVPSLSFGTPLKGGMGEDHITFSSPDSFNLASPHYYTRGKIEVWDFIRDQGLNFHLGNAVKYISRAGHKFDKTEDLKKAIIYLQNELDHAERPHLSRPAPHLPDNSGKGIPINLSGWEFNQSGNAD